LRFSFHWLNSSNKPPHNPAKFLYDSSGFIPKERGLLTGDFHFRYRRPGRKASGRSFQWRFLARLPQERSNAACSQAIPERLCDVGVRNGARLVKRLALRQFGCHAACRYGRDAAEHQKANIRNLIVTDLDINGEAIAAIGSPNVPSASASGILPTFLGHIKCSMTVSVYSSYMSMTSHFNY
jgi:hypothetical protein